MGINNIVLEIKKEIKQTKNRLKCLESAIASLTPGPEVAEARLVARLRLPGRPERRRRGPYKHHIMEILRDLPQQGGFEDRGLTTFEITHVLAQKGINPLSKKPHTVIAAATRRLFKVGLVDRKKQSGRGLTYYLPLEGANTTVNDIEWR